MKPFDKTLEKTMGWLDTLNESLGWNDREHAFLALRAVLHALRDRLLPNEAVDLGAQLPMLVRGFYYEGWHPANKPLKYRDKRHFLDQVHKQAPWIEDDDLERVTTAVFALLSSRLGTGEPGQARNLLPPQLRELWAKPGL
jgi:uncharacterized protein (DUF2267 family)